VDAHHTLARRDLKRGASRVCVSGLCSLLLLAGCVSFGRVALDGDAGEAGSITVSMPPAAPSISQGFSPWHPDIQREQGRSTGRHNGLDIRAVHGTPVIAPARGRVIDAGFSPMYGYTLVIDHGKDARGRSVNSRYFHLSERLVTIGESVARGQQIATLGRSGLLSGGMAHLHFEILRAAASQALHPVNPHLYWQRGTGMVTCYDSSVPLPDTPFATTYPVPCRGVDWQ